MSTAVAGPRENRAPSFWQSTNGKKAVMAVTGAILFLFVVGHLAGNLQVFEGPAKINAYGHFLRTIGEILWAIRIILIVCVVLHIVATVQLALLNWKTRPVGYSRKKAINSSYADRTMYWSGPIVLAFVIFHLLEFTAGYIHPESQFIEGDIYHNIVAGFSVWWVSVWYIFSLLLLGFHLRHGLWSMFQSLGLNHPRHTPVLKQAALWITIIIIAGYISIPISVLAGWVQMNLDARIPTGPIEQAWDNARFEMKLVNPANKRRHSLIVVGSGLAGASASATLGELGYNVKCFCFQDSPRRAHSIAAQGGINAAKNYQNDGDSIYRLFYDTVKGGDFRAREGNVYRLAQNSVHIIDQCVAQGVPFAREYGGSLENRSFGGAQVSRTFYARGQTGQQLLLGAYQALERQVDTGQVTMIPRTEMLDLVVIDGQARGIVARNLITGKLTIHIADAVILATGGYGNVYYLSTNAKGSNATAIWRAHKRGALFANPCFTQIHPTCIPVTGDYQSKLTLMSESLRNDGRIWVPKQKGDKRPPEPNS